MIGLASRSPRRRELLARLGIRFRVIDVAVDETPQDGEQPAALARRLARDKARAGAETAGGLVLGADTVVAIDGRIFGKPADREHAIDMLMTLSGRCHDVFTAVALAGDAQGLAVSASRVALRPLARDECGAYWDTGEPRDKAGGYAIQGLGAVFIERLEGSCSGVMGLPLFETARLLAEAGVRVPGGA